MMAFIHCLDCLPGPIHSPAGFISLLSPCIVVISPRTRAKSEGFVTHTASDSLFSHITPEPHSFLPVSQNWLSLGRDGRGECGVRMSIMEKNVFQVFPDTPVQSSCVDEKDSWWKIFHFKSLFGVVFPVWLRSDQSKKLSCKILGILSADSYGEIRFFEIGFWPISASIKWDCLSRTDSREWEIFSRRFRESIQEICHAIQQSFSQKKFLESDN